ncbi:biotin/lipoyl-containing protein, partial [Streptomyces johnsoniae]
MTTTPTTPPTTREFRLPDLGEGLTGAEITRWLVEVGDHVDIDQPVVEVETAKAQVEVPCPFAGTVTARFGAPGEDIPVGSPLVRVAADAGADAGADAEPGPGQVLVGYGPRSPSPSPTGAGQVAPAHEEPGTGPPLPPPPPPPPP